MLWCVDISRKSEFDMCCRLGVRCLFARFIDKPTTRCEAGVVCVLDIIARPDTVRVMAEFRFMNLLLFTTLQNVVQNNNNNT